MKQNNLIYPFKYPVRSVKYAFILIEVLARNKMEYTLAELINETKLAKGTVYRLLGTLRSLGYVDQNQKKRTYYLTYDFTKIGMAIRERYNLSEIIPIMEKLAQKYNEMVNLAILDRDKVVYLKSIESPHALKLDFKVGSSQPAYCTALGRVLLAYQDSSRLEMFFDMKSFKAYTRQTVTEKSKLMKVFNRVKEQGYSYVSEEYRPGVACVAVPIFNNQGSVAAALSFSVPTVRLTASIYPKMIQSLKKEVKKIKLPHFLHSNGC